MLIKHQAFKTKSKSSKLNMILKYWNTDCYSAQKVTGLNFERIISSWILNNWIT